MPETIQLADQALISRIERVARGRKAMASKTARDLLHERLLELEEHGDPAAVTQPDTQPAPTH